MIRESKSIKKFHIECVREAISKLENHDVRVTDISTGSFLRRCLIRDADPSNRNDFAGHFYGIPIHVNRDLSSSTIIVEGFSHGIRNGVYNYITIDIKDVEDIKEELQRELSELPELRYKDI